MTTFTEKHNNRKYQLVTDVILLSFAATLLSSQMNNRSKTILPLLVLLLLFAACRKNSIPQVKTTTLKVKIPNKIKEPTIISGFYGYVMKYEGDFMPKMSADGQNMTRKPTPVDNKLYIYAFDHREKIEQAKSASKGKGFYELRKIDAKPKYIITPNKYGFYQMDLGEEKYCILIAVDKKHLYYNGGIGVISSSRKDLMQIEMRIDHNATF